MKIGITIGDPAGIGPEIIKKIFRDDHPIPEVEWVIYGSKECLISKVELVDVAKDLDWKSVKPGQACIVSAMIQKRAFNAAISDAQQGKIDAIVTAPWTKYSFTLLNEKPTGHTEVLAKSTGIEPVMLLAGERLRVALVTTHIPLKEVVSHINKENIIKTTQIVNKSLQQDFGIEKPRIAVLGLNPHAGEKGAMGREELDIIGPAIDMLRVEGLDIVGPFSADTYFIRYLHDAGEQHDAVICMYHDQALIPLKTIHFGESANITIGLPLVRTSVDHGSAYDIAGLGIADPRSLAYAMERAVAIVNHRLRED